MKITERESTKSKKFNPSVQLESGDISSDNLSEALCIPSFLEPTYQETPEKWCLKFADQLFKVGS